MVIDYYFNTGLIMLIIEVSINEIHKILIYEILENEHRRLRNKHFTMNKQY